MRFRHIFISGGARGIGAEMCQQMAGEGVVIGIIDVLPMEETKHRCSERGATVHTWIADVRHPEEVQAAARAFLEQTGTIDLVIANAGICPKDLDDYSGAVAREAMDVNYFGAINTFSPFIRTMQQQRVGQLVAISSISSLRSTHNSGSYSASKAALDLWCEGLRLRLAHLAITVTVVNPGFIRTDMTKGNPFLMPGIISKERGARIIMRAIRRRRRSQLLPFRQVLMWGFFRLLPGPIYDWLMLRLKVSSIINHKLPDPDATGPSSR